MKDPFSCRECTGGYTDLSYCLTGSIGVYFRRSAQLLRPYFVIFIASALSILTLRIEPMPLCLMESGFRMQKFSRKMPFHSLVAEGATMLFPLEIPIPIALTLFHLLIGYGFLPFTHCLFNLLGNANAPKIGCTTCTN